MNKITWTFLFLLFVLPQLHAQDIDLAPVTGTVAITNVNIVPSPGKMIKKGTVLVKDGVIANVGTNVSVPVGARIIKADSMYLYPGFILGMSHVGIKMPETKDRPEVKDPGNAPNDLAGITPDRKISQYLDPADKSVAEWRALGFTLAQTAPSGGMLPGTAGVVLLKGNSVGELVILPETALYATFEGARRIYPSNILGVMAEHRELYRQADQAKKFRQLYLSNPAGRERPSFNSTLEAYFPVLEKKMPIAFHSKEILDAQRAMLLQKDLGFNLVLTGLKQGWDLEGEVKEANAKVLFGLDMPEWKEEKKDSAKKEPKSLERQRLNERKEEFTKKYYEQMGQYAKAGIPFGFSGVDAKPADVQKVLQKAVELGLSQDAALAALTTTPASMLGVSKFAGTVENGKMANLLVVSKPYFEKDSKVRYVMIEGKLFEYEDKPIKKADPEKAKKVAGTWNYKLESPEGPVSGNIELKNDNGTLSGTITNTMTNEESSLREVILTDDKLSFSFDITVQGQRMNILGVLTIDGDNLEGTFSSEGEEYEVTGTKNPSK